MSDYITVIQSAQPLSVDDKALVMRKPVANTLIVQFPHRFLVLSDEILRQTHCRCLYAFLVTKVKPRLFQVWDKRVIPPVPKLLIAPFPISSHPFQKQAYNLHLVSKRLVIETGLQLLSCFSLSPFLAFLVILYQSIDRKLPIGIGLYKMIIPAFDITLKPPIYRTSRRQQLFYLL